MIGTWKGNYKYNNKVVQKIIGFDNTGFTIRIDKFDGENFEGIVNDDTETGGMKDSGKIIGTVKNNKIQFKKFMPKNRIIVSAIETRTVPEKKHPTLYYYGTFSKDKNQISGNWKFKRKFTLLFGFIPFLFSPGNGTWKMEISQ